MITPEQKQKYLERTKAQYKDGQWMIWADFLGGNAGTGLTVEDAARNYAKGVAEMFASSEIDWPAFLSQPPL